MKRAPIGARGEAEYRRQGSRPNFATEQPSNQEVPHLASDWHRLSNTFSVQFVYACGVDVAWCPRMPTARELPRLLDRYRVARHQFLAELANRIGGSMAVVEV